MKSKIFSIICIAMFIQASEAAEYIFIVESGYMLKIRTPDQVDLQSAVATGQPLNVEIVSNDPEQEPLDPGAGLSLIANLLPQAIQLNQQYIHGQTLHTQTIHCQQAHFLNIVPVTQASAVKQSRHEAAASAPAHRSGSSGHRALVDENGEKVYPCAYPGCEKRFFQHVERADHHRTHFSETFLDSLDKGERVSCPLCGYRFHGTLAAIMIHIARGHKPK